MDQEVLLRDLAAPGCPICREHERRESRYFFWFFAENYYDRGTLLNFCQALGFCRKHGWDVWTCQGVQSQLTYCYLATTRWLLDRIEIRRHRRREPSLGFGTRSCPACRSYAASERGSVGVLSALFRRGDAWQVYGAKGLLCFEHLRAVIRGLPAAAMMRLYELHRQRLEVAREILADDPAVALSLAVGSEEVAGTYWSHSATASPSPQDNMEAIKRGLGDGGRCPVCSEEARAWSEWTAWLIEAEQHGKAIDDVLPQCPTHLWAAFHAAGEQFARTVAGHAMASCLGDIERAQRWFTRWESERRTPWRRITWTLGRGRSERASFDRSMLRGSPCPVCSRIDTAGRRAVELIGALLLEETLARRFRRGYGLCVPHYLLAREFDLPLEAMDVIEDVERARLAELEWMLTETERKDSWSVRPETKGAEQLAWRAALRRFAGTAVGDTTGVTVSGNLWSWQSRARQCVESKGESRE